MQNKVENFLKSVENIIQPIQLDQEQLKSVYREFLNDSMDALNDREINSPQFQSILISLNTANINFNLIKQKIETEYNRVSAFLSIKTRNKLNNKLIEIQTGKKSLFSQDQIEEINRLKDEVQKANENDIRKKAEDLKSKISDLLSADANLRLFEAQLTQAWKEFDDTKSITQSKIFFHPLLMQKFVEFVSNNTDTFSTLYSEQKAKEFSKNPTDREVFEAELKTIKENIEKNTNDLIIKLNEVLNIPSNQENTVLESKEYKRFIKLTKALQARCYKETKKLWWNNNVFSDEAMELIKESLREEGKSEEEINSEIKGVKIVKFFIYDIPNFFDYLVKSFMKLIDFIGLLPETSQIAYMKEKGKKWSNYVVSVGSECIKTHKLIPLNS